MLASHAPVLGNVEFNAQAQFEKLISGSSRVSSRVIGCPWHGPYAVIRSPLHHSSCTVDFTFCTEYSVSVFSKCVRSAEYLEIDIHTQYPVLHCD